MNKQLVTVGIPVHLDEPGTLEKVSLDQTIATLGDHPITLIATMDVNTAWYERYLKDKATVYIERFDWKGRDAHGQLMTDFKFYERFLRYEYLLICHMDAFVFRNDLAYWCAQGYDYVGSVIYNSFWHGRDGFKHKLLGFKYPPYFGNGGFALKKVETFYHITLRNKHYIAAFHKLRKLRKQGFLNDIFFCQHFPKLYPNFKMPAKEVAQRFGAAYEDWNENDLPFDNRDNTKLPFGVHGWIQYHQDFWRPCINRCGFSF